MLKVLVFVDFSNLMGQCANFGRKPDLLALRDFLADPNEGRFLIDAFVYAPLPPVNGEKVVNFHNYLRSQGFMVIAKRGKRLPDGSTKCDLDGEMMLDAMELSHTIAPDIVVLVTGDGDFAVLAERLRRKGIRVEVASTQQSLAGELRRAAQGSIDLTDWVDDCEALAGGQAGPIGGADIFDEVIGH